MNHNTNITNYKKNKKPYLYVQYVFYIFMKCINNIWILICYVYI